MAEIELSTEEIARHEAGHAVVGRAMGIRTGGVWINPNAKRGTAGACRMAASPPHTFRMAEQEYHNNLAMYGLAAETDYCLRGHHVMSLLAGHEAVALNNGNHPLGWSWPSGNTLAIDDFRDYLIRYKKICPRGSDEYHIGEMLEDYVTMDAYEAAMHLRMLQLRVIRLLQVPRNARAVDYLTHALTIKNKLGAREVRDIIDHQHNSGFFDQVPIATKV